jgi:hypothetical protein
VKLSNALSRRQSLCGLRDRENKREKIEEAEAKKEHTLSPSLWPEKEPDNPYRLSHGVSKSNTPHKNITSGAKCQSLHRKIG